jgi:mRNA interferase MazF
MKKWDIWIIDLPFIKGHEQSGTRPAVIIAKTKTPVVIVIPCTSNTEALRFPYTTEMLPTRRNGLLDKTIAMTFQIRAIDPRRLIKKIGSIDTKHIKHINEHIKKMLL